MTDNLAWHFVGQKIRDGRDIPPDGKWLTHHGKLEMCRSGLHASRRAIDALRYAPGSTICRVQIGGTVIESENEDKLVCTRRKILWRVENADNLLRQFARECALSVIDMWNAPDVVRRYLETGDGSIRVDSWREALELSVPSTGSAARAAASSATWDFALSAARSAVLSASWATGRRGTWDNRYAATSAKLDEFNTLLEDKIVAAHEELIG